MEAIKKRSQREGWMKLRPDSHVPKVSQALSEGAKGAAMTLQEAGQAYAARMFKKVSALAEAANLPAPKNWKDAEIADKIARRAAGLNDVETQVNTIIGLGGMTSDPVLSADSVMEVSCEAVDTEES